MDFSNFFRSTADKIVDLGQAALGKQGRARSFWYDGKGPLVRTKGTTLEVARLKQDATPEQQAQLRRLVYLGAESILERDDTTIEDLVDPEVKGIARVLDNGRLRNVLSNKYAGDKLLFATEAADALPEIQEAPPASAITNMLALNRSLSLDNNSAAALATLLAEREDVRELWQKMDEQGIIRDSMNLRTREDSIKLAERLLEFFKGNNVEPPPQESEAQCAGGEGASGGGGGAQSASFGGDAASFENIEGVLKGDLEDDGKDFDGVAASGFEAESIEFWDKTRSSGSSSGCSHTASTVRSIVDNNDRLGHELSRLLQVRSAARYEHLQTSGKISQSHLYRVALPTIGNGTWNGQVFRKKRQSDCLDTAVTLLVDCSGSMSGEKYAAACAAACIMGNALDTVHVPFEVLGFTDNYNAAVIPVFKPFTGAWSPLDTIAGMSEVAYRLNGNPDAVAVQVASERLYQRRNKRKVLIVLSDGHPASFLANGAGALKHAVAVAENNGIEVFGIGIHSKAVQSFYKHNVVVTDNTKLSATLLNVLDKQLS